MSKHDSDELLIRHRIMMTQTKKLEKMRTRAYVASAPPLCTVIDLPDDLPSSPVTSRVAKNGTLEESCIHVLCSFSASVLQRK